MQKKYVESKILHEIYILFEGIMKQIKLKMECY